MIVEFNKLNQYEQPMLTLCNRSSVVVVDDLERTIRLTDAIGCLNDVSDYEIVWNFNAQSELSFVITLIEDSGDAAIDVESKRMFNAVRGGRSVYVEGYGYFIIDTVKPIITRELTTKEVHALSCENEFSEIGLPYIDENVGIGVDTIMDKILELAPTWQRGSTSQSVREKMRFFENTDVDDCYTFMMEQMQEAFECIFDFDIIERKVNILDQNNTVEETEIQLSTDDFVESVEIQEDTSSFFTSLYVSSSEDVGILSVNPLGTNEIYNLDYYKGDMIPNTLTAWENWELLYNEQREPYMANEENYQLAYVNGVNANAALEILEIRYNIYSTCFDSVLSESLSAKKVTEFNSELTDITKAEITDVGVTDQTPKQEAIEILNESMRNMTTAIINQKEIIAAIEGETVEGITIVKSGYYHNGNFYATRTGEEGSYIYSDLIPGASNKACIEKEKIADEELYRTYLWESGAWVRKENTIKLCEALRQAVQQTVSWANNFTDAQRIELSTFIQEGKYEDEFAIITSVMTYAERMDQFRQLYDRAVSTLAKASQPTYQYTIDADNFVFVRDMKHLTDDLKTGSLIWVELEKGDYAQLFLTTITINYSDADLSLTFGSRYNKNDTRSLYSDTLGNIQKTAATVSFLKDLTLPIKNKKLTSLEEQVHKIRTLALDETLRSNSEEVIIGTSGYTGKAIDPSSPDGNFSPEQVKLVHNRLLFTDDAWETIKTVVGKINYNGQDYYGLDAEIIIGELIMAGKLKISNASGDYSFDENGIQMSFFNDANNNRIETPRITSSVNYTDLSSKQILFDNGDIIMYVIDENNQIQADAMKLSYNGIRLYGNVEEEATEHDWEPNEAAYIAKDSINISRARIFDNIQFQRNEATGQQGNYAWLLFPRSNGNLSLKWTGGAVTSANS